VVDYTLHRLPFFELVYESDPGHRERQEGMDLWDCVVRDRVMLTEIRV
jgi:hypothetical protein